MRAGSCTRARESWPGRAGPAPGRDCLARRRCYRCAVPIEHSFRQGSARVLLLASACLASGCASNAPRPEATAPAAQEAAAAPEPAGWWRGIGDPVLTFLVETGLSRNADMVCRVATFRRRDRDDLAAQRKLGARIGKLFGAGEEERLSQAREARVDRLASRKQKLAESIALAYLEVRRLQERVALRRSVLEQFKDNAEVAGFRRDAGLVPAMDASLASSQDEAARSEAGIEQARLTDAKAALAELAGLATAEADEALGETGTIPELPETAGGSSDPVLRDELGAAVLRQARLEQALDDAKRTVASARTAYRAGVGDFAALYAAESASLDLAQALIDARARRIAASLRNWSGQDALWARAGIEQIVVTPEDDAIPGAENCD